MTDLLQVLPDFDARPFTHLLPSLDKALITTNDVLTLDAAHVARRAQLPPAELRKLADAAIAALHRQLGFGGGDASGGDASGDDASGDDTSRDEWTCISTLDARLDAALGGGIPRGYVVEVTGESGAGKTQLLLTLLLASQLPPPQGLAKSAVYISTEALLSTHRLAQLLSAHPALTSLAPSQKPSLSRILSIQTPDLESQDHILRYQLPVAIKKHNVGLVVLDSVAANYRAEFQKRGHGGNGAAVSMARRGTQLVQLGALLRDLARTQGVAIVVANQVADRFTKPAPCTASSSNSQGNTAMTTPAAVPPPPPSPPSQHDDQINLLLSPDPLALDHQQAWFTGWGDSQYEQSSVQKTPSLGLVWTNQVACRIALKKQPVLANANRQPLMHVVNRQDDDDEIHISKWRRWFKLVFAAWAPPSQGRGVEFEILKAGVTAVDTEKTK